MSEAAQVEDIGYTVQKIQTAPKIRPRISHTHTVVELEVSRESYSEIRYLLMKAGYDHCILDGGAIDLSGIALTTVPEGMK